jgi:uncharacterized membrane protein YfcA
MWDFLLAFSVGSLIGTSRFAQRVVKPLLKLIAVGVVIAGLIYMFVVLRAVHERSQHPHVHTHSTH